jgi:hypothetical protein
MFFLCADLTLKDALSWRHHLHRHRHRMSNDPVRRRGSASDVRMQISVISYWGFRSRIPFSALLLQVVMDVSKHHKSVYYVAFTSLFIQAALSVWFTFTSIAMSVRFPSHRCRCAELSHEQLHDVDAGQPDVQHELELLVRKSRRPALLRHLLLHLDDAGRGQRHARHPRGRPVRQYARESSLL